MKKIIVFGSTGKTGLEIVKNLLSEGHEVTAFVRDPSRLEINSENLKITTGDIFDREAVSGAVQNQDAVVVALGTGQSLGKSEIRSAGTANVIKAMMNKGIKRLLVISAMGVGESWNDLSLINRLFFATLLKNSRRDHEAQEQHIKATRLDWTIIRPSGLTDDPVTGIYGFGSSIRSGNSRIARADVAHLLHRILDDSSYFRKAITITN